MAVVSQDKFLTVFCFSNTGVDGTGVHAFYVFYLCQVGYPGHQPSPNSPAERTAEWLGRYVVDSDVRAGSPNRESPGNSNRNSTASNSSAGYLVSRTV